MREYSWMDALKNLGYAFGVSIVLTSQMFLYSLADKALAFPRAYDGFFMAYLILSSAAVMVFWLRRSSRLMDLEALSRRPTCVNCGARPQERNAEGSFSGFCSSVCRDVALEAADSFENQPSSQLVDLEGLPVREPSCPDPIDWDAEQRHLMVDSVLDELRKLHSEIEAIDPRVAGEYTKKIEQVTEEVRLEYVAAIDDLKWMRSQD